MIADPFACVRPRAEVASQVAALPYDVYDRGEAREAVQGRPLSFLNIDRPETQFDASQDMYAPEVYARARELFDARLADGTFVEDEQPCYYLYRLMMGKRAQTGFVGCCSIDDYLDGTIRRHENTRAEKERDRIRHIEALGAQTGPIFLAYRGDAKLARLREETCAQAPLYDFTADDGVRHTVWRVAEPARVEEIRAAFGNVRDAYVADGHHRAASAVKVGLRMREKHPGYTGAEPFNFFLSVLFDADELAILPYNRVVADLGTDARGNARTPERLLADTCAAGFAVMAADEPVQPDADEHGTFGMYLAGGWWKLFAPEGACDGADPVARLDVSVLQERLLRPVFGIGDPRTDARISFVGGIRGTDELERRARDAGGVAFTVRATQMAELLGVADAGMLMPPKSTWFEPKLRSGLFIHRIS